MGILFLVHWFCLNIVIHHCKKKVILITCCVLRLYLASSTKFSTKLNLPTYNKALPYIYRHIWFSLVLLPSWAWNGKHIKSKPCCSNNYWGQRHCTFTSDSAPRSGTAMEEQEPPQQRKKVKNNYFLDILLQNRPKPIQTRKSILFIPTGKEK